MRLIEWMSDGGRLCSLRIEDGSEAVVRLDAGAEPMVTQMDDGEDAFMPLRTQSGNIRIVGEVDDVEALVGAAPLERAMVLEVDGVVAWRGFLMCETYTQAWDAGPIEFDIPVVSPLGILDSQKPSSNKNDLGYMSFARLLVDINEKLGGVYERFIFPTLTEPATTLRYQFCMGNYAEENSDGSGHEMSSYYEILEDVCKFFGWQAQENGDALVFQAADAPGEHLCYTALQLEEVAEGSEAEGELLAVEVDTLEIFGAGHSLDHLPGKKSVRAAGNVNAYDSEFFAWDITKGEVGSTYSRVVEKERKRYYYYTKNYKSGGEVYVRDDDNNFRYENFVAQTDYYAGSCMVSERELVVEARTGALPESDTGWVDRLMFRVKGMDYGDVYLRLSPRQRYIASGLTNKKYFQLRMSVKRSASYDGEWEEYTGYLVITMKVGDRSIYEGIVAIREGQLRWSYRGASVGLTGDGFCIGCPTWSGDVEVEFTVPNALSLDGWSDYDAEYYYSIEEFSIDVIDDWTKYIDREVKSVNVEKKDIDGGFTETYSSECGLTTYRAGQYGTGVVIGADASSAPPTTLYGGKTAELARMERMLAVYSGSREKLGVIVRGNGRMPEAWKMYEIDTRRYVCVSADVDWRSEEVKVRVVSL